MRVALVRVPVVETPVPEPRAVPFTSTRDPSIHELVGNGELHGWEMVKSDGRSAVVFIIGTDAQVEAAMKRPDVKVLDPIVTAKGPRGRRARGRIEAAKGFTARLIA